MGVIESYLRKTFHKPERGLLARLCGEEREYSYEIREMKSHVASRELVNSDLTWVAVNDSYLDRVRLPLSRPGAICRYLYGMFSFKSQESRELYGSATKGGYNDAIPASALAELFNDAVLSTKSEVHEVLTEFSGEKCESSGYIFDAKKRRECQQLFFTPQKTKYDDRLEIEFFSFVGAPFRNYSLAYTRLTIGHDLHFHFELTVSVADVFSRVPLLRAHNNAAMTTWKSQFTLIDQ